MRNIIESKGNQFVNYANVVGSSAYGITVTKNNDGKSVTVNGTSTGFTNQRMYTYTPPNPVVGHRILMLIGNDHSEITWNVADTSERGANNNCIYTKSRADFVIRMYCQTSGITINNEQITLQLVDLTTMYGAGNEPTTVEQFLTDHPEYNDYVPYPGILKKYKVLETAGQVDLGTLTIEKQFLGQVLNFRINAPIKLVKSHSVFTPGYITAPGFTTVATNVMTTTTLPYRAIAVRSNSESDASYLKGFRVQSPEWNADTTVAEVKQALQGIIATYETYPSTYLITETP